MAVSRPWACILSCTPTWLILLMTTELNSVMAKINSPHTMMDSEHHTHKRFIIPQRHRMRWCTQEYKQRRWVWKSHSVKNCQKNGAAFNLEGEKKKRVWKSRHSTGKYFEECKVKKPTHWKRPWCWERLKAGGEGDDRGWDSWMASLTQWTWV